MSPYNNFTSTGAKTILSSQRSTRAVALVTPLVILNLCLVAAAGLLVLYYVMQANAIAANNYTIRTLNEKAFTLSDTRMTLSEKRAQLEDPDLLTSFALSHNMVEANEVSYVFEAKNVAYQR